MKLNRKWSLMLMAITGLSAIFQTRAVALPNVKLGGQLRTTQPNITARTAAATCKPATAVIDLDINNVRARLMTGGDMWWNQGTSEAAYEVPKNSRKSSLFAGSVWVGGYDDQGQLKVAAQTYRQDGNDYWPGPLDQTPAAQTTAGQCSDWDRFWKVNKSDILAYRDLVASGGDVTDARFDVIKQWPARGNNNQTVSGSIYNLVSSGLRDYAPFVDADQDGKYNPLAGDYPNILGDQYIWWVFNDRGNIKSQTQTDGIGLEVQGSAFGFATKDQLNDATFYRYRLINRSSLSLDSTFIATWTDADLGYAFDDFIGCDTNRGLGILYNGRSTDGNGQVNSYGSDIPMVGVDFFRGPRKYYRDPVLGVDTFRYLGMEAFTYFNNDFTEIGNPGNGQQIYNYMTGTNRNGQPFTNDFKGPGIPCKAYGEGPITKYVFSGDPGAGNEWSECTCVNKADDRRFIHSAGPFRLESGASARSENEVTIGVVWVPDVGGCPSTSFRSIRSADDRAQDAFDTEFRLIEGPEAPRLVIRELDRKFVIYIVNDPISNNYREQYGFSDSVKYHSKSAKSSRFSDSLYKFEGYRVFQLSRGDISASQIFLENGQVNTEVAYEINSSDLKNGVTTLVNWTRNTGLNNGNDSTYVGTVRVSGKDSGITHSFSVEVDRFAKGTDTRFVNYRQYYFTAIAYAYNDFAAKINPATKLPVASFSFASRDRVDSTQDMPYLESIHGAGGTPIRVDTAMPNPSNGEMGTYLNSDYGDGVMVHRLEGLGNSGNFERISDENEARAISSTTSPSSIDYKIGNGPVNVRVVDPVTVRPGNWELYVSGPLVINSDTLRGRNIKDSGSWKLVYMGTGTTDTIYSEKNIGTLNEQILERYGISIKLNQVTTPGVDQSNGNGLIGTSVSYADPSQNWLSGVHDGENAEPTNWIRSGKNTDTGGHGYAEKNFFNDNKLDTIGQYYEQLFNDVAALKGTWTAYQMVATPVRSGAFVKFNDMNYQESPSGMPLAPPGSDASTLLNFRNIHGVDLVFTSDKSKWTKCVVIEMQDLHELCENGGYKFFPRRHPSWRGDLDGNGNPVYTTEDSGRSLFPGYAIDQETGERLNIAFGEDSYLSNENGRDMIWNPTSQDITPTGSVLYGGKHAIFIGSTRYDNGDSLVRISKAVTSATLRQINYNRMFMWAGLPLIPSASKMKSLRDGYIPTETRLSFRVNRPLARYIPNNGNALRNNGYPLFSFSTDGLEKSGLSDANNPYNSDKQALLDRINAVPNPYYGYAGYENTRYDTRVRITGLPANATVMIYTVDGSLIRRLTKSNNQAYLDWDLRNSKNLNIASGMYLIHVTADGIGEKVIRWFGAMRPIDITNY